MMNSLPDDIVINILSRLPIKTLMRCRCVCKLWSDLARGPRLIQSHLNNRSSQKNPSFILNSSICFDDDSFRSQIYFLEHNETLGGYTCEEVSFSLPDLQEFRVVSSCNGLLCLVHRMNRNTTYVCNPFTRCYIKVPDRIEPLQNNHRMVMGFGFNPKGNEYKVVQIVHYFPELQSEVFVHTLGDGCWRGIGNIPYIVMVTWQSVSSEAFVCGTLHWRSTKHIVTFDIANEVFGVIPYPEIVVGGERGGSFSFSLAVLDGCLAATNSTFHDRIELWIMKYYGVKESWVKSFSINLYVVGWNIRYSRTLCVQGNGEFLMLHNNNQALLSYSPLAMRLSKLSIAGLPSWFEVVNHVGSLVSLSGC